MSTTVNINSPIDKVIIINTDTTSTEKEILNKIVEELEKADKKPLEHQIEDALISALAIK